MKGGPAIEGEYLAIRPAESATGNNPPRQVGPRVRLKPGRDYILSGWVRIVGNRYARLGWRCVDRDGKQVGNGQISMTTAGERFWSRGRLKLTWPRNDGGGDGESGQRLPVTAAYLEPVVDGGGAFDLAALSLVELPPPLPASTPEP